MERQSSHTAGVIFAIISSAVFGLIPLFSVPLMAAGVQVTSVVFYRFLISSLAMGCVMAIRRTNLRLTGRELRTLLFLSVFYAITALFLTWSYKFIPTGVATTIHFLYPVMVTIIMYVVFKEKTSPATLFAIGLALFGVALLSISGSGRYRLDWRGVVIVLVTVVSYATYLASIQKSAVKDMDGLKITFYLVTICTILFGVNCLVVEGGFSPIPDASSWVNLLLLSLMPTLISNLTLIQAVKRLGSTVTAAFGCLEPLTAVLMGILVFHERCSATQLAGMAIVIAAVTVVVLQPFTNKTNKERP